MKSSDNGERFGNLDFCNTVLVSHLFYLKNQNNIYNCKNELRDATVLENQEIS